jgi:hypothetical protein
MWFEGQYERVQLQDRLEILRVTKREPRRLRGSLGVT